MTTAPQTQSPELPDDPELYDPEDSDNVCYLCGRPEYELVYEVDHFGFPFRFQRCRCGLVKQTPMPTQRFFEWFFNSEVFFSAKRTTQGKIWGFYDYFKDEPSRLATSKLRYRRFEGVFRELGHPLRILKIGPSTGTFLHVAQEHGHQVLGCDVSSQFVEYARQTYDVEIQQGRFEEIGYPDDAFDVILLFNVIENVPNQVEFLEAVRRCLAPGGLFIFNFVDMKRNWVASFQKGKYFLYRPPICYIYDHDVMQKVMDRFGFEVREEIRDMRYLTLEKISTLLGWTWLHRLSRGLRLHRRPFPLYAYPSKIWVAQGDQTR